jgi:hypothetical protein
MVHSTCIGLELEQRTYKGPIVGLQVQDENNLDVWNNIHGSHSLVHS